MSQIQGRVKNPSGLTMEKQRNPHYGKNPDGKDFLKPKKMDNLSRYVEDNLARNVDKRYGENR